MTQDEIWRPETKSSVISQKNAALRKECLISSSTDSEKDLEKQDLEDLDEYGAARAVPSSSIREVYDPNLVQWDGINDPENPKNWKRSKKWTAIGLGKHSFTSQYHKSEC